MCRHMCPVGHITHLETRTPHGWAQLVASEKRGLIEWSEDTVAVMYDCADCGVCQSHCVTDQPLPDAIAAVRDKLVDSGHAPGIVSDLKARFEAWGNLYKEESPQEASETGEYALFIGDSDVHLWPDTIPAVLALLKAAGVEPVLVGNGRNTGFLASSLGLVSTAEQLADKNLESIQASDAKRLLVLDPATRYAFEHIYPERLNRTLPDTVELVDVVLLLDQKYEEGLLKFNRIEVGLPYAYVDPSHAIRFSKRHEAPRRLLNAVLPTPVLELFWRKERAHPLGDGALHHVNPSLSNALTQARVEDAKQAGAQGIVTEDSSALYHLHHSTPSGLPVKGLYELLADRIS